MLGINHRLIRTYEIASEDSPSEEPIRVEIWKDLEARRFWPRVYKLVKDSAGESWHLDSWRGWNRMFADNEQTVLESVLNQLGEN